MSCYLIDVVLSARCVRDKRINVTKAELNIKSSSEKALTIIPSKFVVCVEKKEIKSCFFVSWASRTFFAKFAIK